MTPHAPRIIIVDDEVLARENIEALLQNDTDVTIVAQCSNGQQTLDAVKKHKPDLLFLDVQMPGLDGFDILGRRWRPNFSLARSSISW